MSEAYDISVAMGTVNRAHMLPRVLASLFAQNAHGLRYEIIVVDNGSTDRTREVIEGTIAARHPELVYAFEPRKGVSYARNRAIELARSSLIAFTDDDQEAAPDWLAVAYRTLCQNPEIDMVGGPVMPIWDTAPPTWILTREDKGPLSLVNGGETPFRVSTRRWFCFGAGNFACRRDALLRVGGFSPDYPRSQDRELQLRLLLGGSEGLYVPAMVMFHHVDGRRFTRSHYRRWSATEGRMRAGYAFDEMFLAPDGVCGPLPAEAPRLLGVSPVIYRRLLMETATWVREAARGRRVSAFRHERQVRYLWSYIRRRHELHGAADHPVGAVQLIGETLALALTKLDSRSRQGLAARTSRAIGRRVLTILCFNGSHMEPK